MGHETCYCQPMSALLNGRFASMEDAILCDMIYVSHFYWWLFQICDWKIQFHLPFSYLKVSLLIHLCVVIKRKLKISNRNTSLLIATISQLNFISNFRCLHTTVNFKFVHIYHNYEPWHTKSYLKWEKDEP